MDAHPAHPREALSVVIVTGGDPVAPETVRAGGIAPDLVIAADSGLDHAVDAGLSPTVLVGDLDSVSAERLEAFRTAGGEIIAHPADKDDTDLALAIGYAVEHGATRITVYGGAGQRLSHVFGNCAAIVHAVRCGVHSTWRYDGAAVHIAAPGQPVALTGDRSDLVSLLPFGGQADGVSTAGLRWTLERETLHADATRGVSNEMVTTEAAISIESGLLLVIHERTTNQ